MTSIGGALGVADRILAVHGFGFDPEDLKDGRPGKHSPEQRFGPEIRAATGVDAVELFQWYSVPPTFGGFKRTWLRWPPYLHRYRHAWDLSYSAAKALAGEIKAIVRGGDTIGLIGHSLGTRVVLFALAQLMPSDLAMVRGVLLLNGAALQSDASTAVHYCGYMRLPVTLNVAVRTDDVLKRLGSKFVPGRGRCIGNHGLTEVLPAERWRDVFLDDRLFLQRARELRGWDLNGDKPDHIADHWWSYRNPDNATLLSAWADGDRLEDLLPA